MNKEVRKWFSVKKRILEEEIEVEFLQTSTSFRRRINVKEQKREELNYIEL